MHAVANTPAESWGAHFALFPHDGSLPRFLGGSASALRLSRPAQRSLTLRPAYLPSHLHDLLHRRLQPLRCLRGCSDCYRLERPCRAGFAPAEKPCLRTAHQDSYAKEFGLSNRGAKVRSFLGGETVLPLCNRGVSQVHGDQVLRNTVLSGGASDELGGCLIVLQVGIQEFQ
jgi:hypothetical protein